MTAFTDPPAPADPGAIDAAAGKPETAETTFVVDGERRTLAEVAR